MMNTLAKKGRKEWEERWKNYICLSCGDRKAPIHKLPHQECRGVFGEAVLDGKICPMGKMVTRPTKATKMRPRIVSKRMMPSLFNINGGAAVLTSDGEAHP
jgi:hypothetical protein